ncbi:unnamed protein product [Protopolystoma xenopodis]|uniref:SNF2 N-terminal domain-containing protein n=1 Tax=Protopolystoma xenopodis TaxID=117903 RepID=A0A448X0Q1_9PLAT|nr:unnamed protein product [Protopolystoma xenopodis]
MQPLVYFSSAGSCFSRRTSVGQSDNPDDQELLPGFVQPAQLASADIVLTAYSVVQRELDWAEVTSEQRAGISRRPQLRVAQRYLFRPSPLTCVKWWRVSITPFNLSVNVRVLLHFILYGQIFVIPFQG